jgi:ribonucleoside-triphosphate reductase (thioredoxin)
VRLAHVDLELLRAAQRMLLRLGIVSSIRDSRPLDGKGGHAAADGRARLELVIANAALIRFEEIGFVRLTTRKLLDSRLAGYVSAPNPERFAATVAAVEPDGVEPVFDCTVPGSHAFDANGLFVHNCGEVSLRPFAFCNLSIAVARVDDTFESLRDKVEVATLIGTIQSLATHFPHLRPEWRRNCEEERLLGVDVNGQMDSPVAQDAQVQRQLREVAVEVNRRTAEQLGINPSAAVTCVKPSGNSAVLFDCSSGLHARWSPYYIRNVRVAASSPLFKVLRDAGAPMDPENGQLASSADTWVVHFPVAAPAGAVTRRDRTALAQCEYWLQVKSHWTEHNPSVTITYQPDEEIDLLQWIWEHRGIIGGMTFFPADNAAYAQQPYVEITRQEYEQLAARFPAIDFAKVYRYEESDLTTTAQELACLAGVCDIDLAPPRA